MGFDTAFARLEELGAAALALLPGILLGLLAFGLFLLLTRALRAGVVRAARARGVAPRVGIVLGRTGSGLCPLLGGLVTAAIAFPSINAADLFSVPGIGGVAIGFAFRDIPCLAMQALLHDQPKATGGDRARRREGRPRRPNGAAAGRAS